MRLTLIELGHHRRVLRSRWAWDSATAPASLTDYFISGALPWWLAGHVHMATTFAADTLAVQGLVPERPRGQLVLVGVRARRDNRSVLYAPLAQRRSRNRRQLVELRYGGKRAACAASAPLHLLLVNSIIIGVWWPCQCSGGVRRDRRHGGSWDWWLIVAMLRWWRLRHCRGCGASSG
jgi:hypothetical protein